MKGKIIAIILVLVAIILLAPIMFRPKDAIAPVQNGKTPEVQIEGNKEDLVSFSINPGQEVSGIVKTAGVIKGGYFFEANILTNILDSNKKLLKAGHGTATTDWMTSEPVTFTTNLDFTNLPKGKGYIEIHNDNASGLPENDKSVLIPIVIKEKTNIENTFIKNPQNFSGTITALDNGCWVDGICKIQVDSKIWITYNIGRNLKQLPIGVIDGEFKIGAKVEVYGEKDADNTGEYTIVGNTKYYIKVIK